MAEVRRVEAAAQHADSHAVSGSGRCR
jgi:hypothetical protein